MLHLHLSYQQIYCLLRCDLYERFYGRYPTQNKVQSDTSFYTNISTLFSALKQWFYWHATKAFIDNTGRQTRTVNKMTWFLESNPQNDVMTWKYFPYYWLLARESTGHRWILLPLIRPVMWICCVFFYASLNKLLNKQSSCHGSEMPWHSWGVTVMSL